MRFFRPPFLLRALSHGALFRVRGAEGRLFLTFDDGPDPVSTPLILDSLSNLGIKACFFCSGSRAELYPDLVSRIKSEGHLVGNHGFRHLNGWLTATEEYVADIKRADSFTSSDLLRPPYGKLSPSQFYVLKADYNIVFWDLMPYDFDKKLSLTDQMQILRKKIRPGSIIVMHDSMESTAAALLPALAAAALEKGYSFGDPSLLRKPASCLKQSE